MVDVSSQSNKVNITVSSSGVLSNVSASGDTTMYYSNKAREWAISNRIVDGVDYSSKYYAGKANESALNAQSFAQSAQDSYKQFESSVADSLNTIDDKVQEATDNIEIQKQDTIAEIQDVATTQKEEIENLSEQEQNKIVDLGIDTRANIDLSNLSTNGEKHFLNKSQITNCLLEVPQRIKLELVDGTLTLKSGSEVIVPNGFEADGVTLKFDYVDIENDISETSTLNTTCMVSLCIDDNTLIFRPIVNYQSGTQSPSSQVDNSNYYYTDTNLVKDKISSGAVRGSSLPVAIVSVSSTQITSINQTFNGLGYIGSTVWVDKGVKGLIPNGRNEDGTLKNIEFTTDKILMQTQPNATANIDLYLSKTEVFRSTLIYYNEKLNLNISSDDGANVGAVLIGNCTLTNGAISNFSSKQPVSLATIDMVDGRWVSVDYKIVSDTALGANASATYDLSSFLPKDGHIYEVLFSLQAITGSTSGYDVNLSLGTDITPNFIVARGITRASDYVSCVGTPTVPVGNARRITIKQWSSNPCRIVSLTAVCYRRVGISL